MVTPPDRPMIITDEASQPPRDLDLVTLDWIPVLIGLVVEMVGAGVLADAITSSFSSDSTSEYSDSESLESTILGIVFIR